MSSPRSLALSFSVLLAVSACGGESAPTEPAPPPLAPLVTTAPPAPPPPPAPAPSWLYEVGPEGSGSYLFVSNESGTSLHDSFPSDYEALFRHARVVVAATAVPDDDLSQAILDGMRHERHPVERAVSPATLTAITDLIARDIPPQLIPHLSSGLALQLVGARMLANARAPRSDIAMLSPTHELVGRRQTVGAAVVGLDSLDDLQREIADYDRAGAASALEQLMTHVDEYRALVRAVIDAYDAHDEDALVRAIEAPTPGAADFDTRARAVIADMVERWMPVIEREITTGNAFIVLDAPAALGEHERSRRCVRTAFASCA